MFDSFLPVEQEQAFSEGCLVRPVHLHSVLVMLPDLTTMPYVFFLRIIVDPECHMLVAVRVVNTGKSLLTH